MDTDEQIMNCLWMFVYRYPFALSIDPVIRRQHNDIDTELVMSLYGWIHQQMSPTKRVQLSLHPSPGTDVLFARPI